MSRVSALDDLAQRLELAEARLSALEEDGSEAGAELRRELAAVLGELRSAEAALRAQRRDALFAFEEERRRYHDLFDFAPDAYLVTDGFGKVLQSNHAAAALLRVSKQRLEGKPLAVFFGEHDRRRLRRLLLRAGELTETAEVELQLRRRDGSLVELAMTLAGRGPEGVTGLRWLLRDVTARRDAERRVEGLARDLEQRVRERTSELEQERERLAAIVSRLPAGVAVAEAPTGRVVLANEQLSRIWGQEIAAGSVADYAGYRAFHRDGRPYEPEDLPIARSLLEGEVVTGEVVAILRGDDSTGFVEVNSTPIRRDDGSIAAAIAVVSHVTERERRERAEREFVTNAAHELQTPLAAIVSAAEVLDAGAKEVPEDRDRFLAHIRRECARLTRLVQALLVLARAQTGTEPPPAEPVDLQPLLDEVALSLHPAAGVEVRVDCPSGLAVLGNRRLLEQAVSNLGTNAAKYTPSGTIRLAGHALDDEQVAIEVADSGPGIPRGDEYRVFDRFYRPGVRDRDGFGLGLAIVRQAVEALGGEVELRPGEDGGTVARILVSRARKEE